jgi:hypothetical protein
MKLCQYKPIGASPVWQFLSFATAAVLFSSLGFRQKNNLTLHGLRIYEKK